MLATQLDSKTVPTKSEETRKCCEKGTTMCVLLVVCYALIGLALFMVWRKVLI
jgi:hypothetical protein